MRTGIYIAIAVLTVAYAIYSGIMDVKTRKIYVFPAWILSAGWIAYMICFKTMGITEILSFVSIHLALYTLFTVTNMWGQGDSDMMLLFGTSYLASIGNGSVIPTVGVELYVFELVVFIFALCATLFTGFMEAKYQRRVLKKTSTIAVVPGFSVAITVVLLTSVIRMVVR